jgi:predicted Zn-dependent protease
VAHNLFFLVLVLGVSFFTGCMTVPGTHKRALNILPRSQELQMGEEAYQEILKKEKRSKNPKLTSLLERVGQRISQVTGITDFKWEFALIENPQMNAFCLPGGKVAFYTGILPVLENEGAMAIVMGHEVAHAVAQHGAQRVSQALVTQLGLAAIDVAILKDSKYRNLTLGLLGAGAQFGVLLPHSRSNETEADSLGIRYAAQAGYDPAEGAAFWERFSRATGAGGKPPEFMSTHPSDTSRIENLKGLSQEVMQVYLASPQYGKGEKLL